VQGTNWRNYNITIKATVEPAINASGGGGGGAAWPVYASLCGRIPVWPLRLEVRIEKAVFDPLYCELHNN
jgi:hypothetical protein